MGRERQFSEAEVLQAAVDVFTVHGYQGASLARLQEATGVAKQSLYNCFGDKRDLYLQALDAGVERYAGLMAQMAAAATGRQAIELFVDRVVGGCAGECAVERGCIITAGLLENIDEPLVAERLVSKWEGSREHMLRAHVERGQKDGSIVSRLPSATLADLLMSLLSGLRVAAGANLGRQRLERVAALGLSLLDHR